MKKAYHYFHSMSFLMIRYKKLHHEWNRINFRVGFNSPCENIGNFSKF